jgi:4-hydroxy-tetrahydrodipicolinate synthase
VASPTASRTPRRDRGSSTFVISITPFRDGRLDEAGFRQHLQRMASAGVGVYVGGGGSGEGYALDAAETRRVLEIAAEELAGTVPVRAMGVEPRLASQMVEYVQMASSVGIEACQIYSLDQGHGHRPRMDELETYFCDILDAVDVPCVLSTHQSVGYQVPVPMLVRLSERFPHIIGVNSSHQDIAYLRRIIDGLGEQLTVHVGGPLQALTSLAFGGDGFLSSEANLAPRMCQEIVAAHDRGDLAATFGAFTTVARLFEVLYGNGGIRATKAVLTHYGLPGGEPRKPQLPVSADVAEQVVDAVEALGIPAAEGFGS